jgi:sugar phosphate isomerase/epimerase
MPRMPLGVMIGIREDLGERLGRLHAAGFTTMQTSRPADEYMAEPKLGELKRTIAEAGFVVTSVAAIDAGESYADVETVRRTVGLLPPATRAERIADTKRCAGFANALGGAHVSSHIGYIPEDRSHPDYQALAAALRDICDYLKPTGRNFNLETGQETAEALRAFIGDVDRPNLGVNFDPANMILYGTGDPIEALGILAPWVRSVHCKDGNWPSAPGQLGQEQRLGDGQVGLERFLAKLIEIGYDGPLTVEREVPGEQQMTDFLYAGGLLKELKMKLGVS